jgi:hypothetical protein
MNVKWKKVAAPYHNRGRYVVDLADILFLTIESNGDDWFNWVISLSYRGDDMRGNFIREGGARRLKTAKADCEIAAIYLMNALVKAAGYRLIKNE